MQRTGMPCSRCPRSPGRTGGGSLGVWWPHWCSPCHALSGGGAARARPAPVARPPPPPPAVASPPTLRACPPRRTLRVSRLAASCRRASSPSLHRRVRPVRVGGSHSPPPPPANGPGHTQQQQQQQHQQQHPLGSPRVEWLARVSVCRGAADGGPGRPQRAAAPNHCVRPLACGCCHGAHTPQ
jgi:hypothetical protein